MPSVVREDEVNNDQGDLFGYPLYDGHPPRQRHSRTSRDAAETIRYHIGPLHKRVLDFLARNRNGASDERMSNILGMGLNTLRPRRRELELLGRVIDSGRTELTASGREAVMWILTPAPAVVEDDDAPF